MTLASSAGSDPQQTQGTSTAPQQVAPGSSAQASGPTGSTVQGHNVDDDEDEEDDDDQDFGDWIDDDEEGQDADDRKYADLNGQTSKVRKTPTFALFPDGPGQPLKLFSQPRAALDHAKAQGCDLVGVVRKNGLDALQVIRLLNYIRRHASKAAPLSPQQVAAFNGTEAFLNDDAELNPVPGFEMDGLLQLDFDEESFDEASSTNAPAKDTSRPSTSELESEVAALRLALNDLREQYAASIGLTDDDRAAASASNEETGAVSSAGLKAKAKMSPFAGVSRTHAPLSVNDKLDDEHYFTSYASNDIHQTMISDTVRTLSYAKFILSPQNAHLFRNKIVMDVGCGSGILSLFAARAGAASVLAIDASDIANRTVQNIQENGFGPVIRVFKGKIEDLDSELAAYEGKVDVIISEWMGYFLIYEAMLPSVLYARDRYLRKPTQIATDGTSKDGGILAPSHTRMTLAAAEDGELLHERIHFWNDVYGFKMSSMTKGLTDDAYTESLKAEALITDTANIFDLPLMTMSTQQPEFQAPFSLTASRKGTVHAFLSWFDTWFLPAPLSSPGLVPADGKRDMSGGEVLPGLPACETREPTKDDVRGIELRGSEVIKETQLADGSEGEAVSFTTGPAGKETHWKQTAFLLKDPIEVEKGSTISGRINVTQSTTHSRELEVEIHYLVQQPDEHTDTTGAQGTGRPKAKRVQTSLVQCFAVR